MAIFFFDLKHGSRSRGYSALKHLEYILRENYCQKGDDHKLVFSLSGNLPIWSQDEKHFWQAVDTHEAIHARLYSEFVVALPHELSREQHVDLVKSFIAKELERYPYTLGIHAPSRAFGEGTNPHAHIMFSSRRFDGIERNEKDYFRHFGGNKKCREFMPKARLISLRQSWAESVNQSLEKAGYFIRVSHLSLADQGIDREPLPKISSKETALYRQGLQNEKTKEIESLRTARQTLEIGAKQQQKYSAELKELQADLSQYEALEKLKAMNTLKQSLEQNRQESQRLIERSQKLMIEQSRLESSLNLPTNPHTSQLIALERSLADAENQQVRVEFQRKLAILQRSLEAQQEEMRRQKIETHQKTLAELEAIAQEQRNIEKRIVELRQYEQEALSTLQKNNTVTHFLQFSVGQDEEAKQQQQERQQEEAGLGLKYSIA